MKRFKMIVLCLLVIVAASLSVKAQEVTVVLNPGWTWISCPTTEVVDIDTAFENLDFTPMQGDIIKSKWGLATYNNGQWRGSLTQFSPGYGYHYKSNRTEPVTLTIGSHSSPVSVTTLEPTAITLLSALVGGDVTLGEGNHVFARGVCWGTDPNPDIDSEHIAGDAVAGSQSYVLHGLTSSTTYYVRAYVVTDYGLAYGEEVSFLTESNQDEHACVDLGLPSGTLWAVCNVGANAPEDYGFYFAWGETQEKDYYGWDNYQYCNGGFYDEYGDFQPYLTKYCNNSDNGYNGFIDNLTTLLPEDDAATAYWGDDWRMPTLAECEELFNNTTVTWTNQNGEDGLLFTAPNGKCLFLPAAGYRDEGDLYGAGNHGRYWSSSLSMDSPKVARIFSFNWGDYYMAGSDRYYGRTVRPVRSAPQNSVTITVLSNPTEGGIVSGGGTYEQGQSCTVTATANSGYTFVNWTENGEEISTDATYSFTVNGNRNLVANFAVSGGGDHAYVDLGLPSGLLWATCNVGADNPEDYGDYFAWGETQPKDTYNWNYQYCNGSGTTFTKYCNNSSYGYNGFTDTLTTLLPEDDAATANWGGDWRMPTKEEFEELCNNTTVTWTTQNGVNGRLFTASNGNSLFLPAAGIRDNSWPFFAGSEGYYWSSSLNTDGPDPEDTWLLYFDPVNYGIYCYSRIYGRSVRPVRDGSQNTAPTGAINGKFTINENGGQVYFSQGNLQYQASTDTWRFAENQWDYVGDDNSNISSTYGGWIDLFGWGTSGWNSGNTYYHPWDSNSSNGSLYGPPGQYNLTGSYANADWGVYNLISNGGNMANQWRTLIAYEWGYVFDTRTTTSGIRYAKANVNNVNGVILLPDDWSSSTYSLNNTNVSEASFSGNTLTVSQWSILEQAGAVFLPAAGHRGGTSVYDVGSYGFYWSASYNSNGASSVRFSDRYLYTYDDCNRYDGFSVRLVRVAE